MTPIDMITAYVPVLLLLILLSFMFVDWPGWRWLETLLVGGGIGNLVVQNYFGIIRTGITPMMSGSIQVVPGIIFGALLYFRFYRKYAWVARYGFLWIMGVGAGVLLNSVFQGNVFVMITRAVTIMGSTLFETVNNVLAFIIFITILTYFIFTKEHKGPLGISTKLGRYFLMITFGVSYAVLISMFYYVTIERVWWILQTLGLYKA